MNSSNIEKELKSHSVLGKYVGSVSLGDVQHRINSFLSHMNKEVERRLFDQKTEENLTFQGE